MTAPDPIQTAATLLDLAYCLTDDARLWVRYAASRDALRSLANTTQADRFAAIDCNSCECAEGACDG